MRVTATLQVSGEDIGERVSVRSRIPARAGQPRHTDTVGYLRGWSEGAVTIERRDGEIVTLDEAAIVAGRVVGKPPRRRGRGT